MNRFTAAGMALLVPCVVAAQEPGGWVLDDLELWPYGGKGGAQLNFVPVLRGDTLLATTGLRLFAIDASSGEVRWDSGEPAGFRELERDKRQWLFEDIDFEGLLLAPAASADVVVAALQIPYTTDEPQEYQGIGIMTAIPQRRLFAFDLETGRELWNHAPPEDWEGESGPYEERMLVTAAPVLSGSRAVVPCYRLREGLIDFDLACYELETGERVWSTHIVSGKRELNTGGRQLREFCAGPVAIEGDRIVVLTGLGMVACVEAGTGRVQWRAEYEPFPIPEARIWSSRRRTVVWRTAPPVIADGVVVATPIDSGDILRLKLSNGRVLWSPDADGLPPHKKGSYDVLVGGDGDAFYLGGAATCALRNPDSLRFLELLWTHAAGSTTWRVPRPVPGDDEILVFTEEKLIFLDRKTGFVIHSRTIELDKREAGNAVLGSGMVFVQGRNRIYAFPD